MAKVSKTGLVKAVKKGKATITATADNGKKITCVVTVQNGPVTTPVPTETPVPTPTATPEPTSTHEPTPTPSGSKCVKQVAADYRYSLVLLEDGTLYSFRSNNNNKLNSNTTTDAHVPKKVGEGYTAISARMRSSMALKGDALYTWGENNWGQLGIGSRREGTYRNTPQLVGGGYTVLSVSGGNVEASALKGTDLYSWGLDAVEMEEKNHLVPTLVDTGVTAYCSAGMTSLTLKGTELFVRGGTGFSEPSDWVFEPMSLGTGFHNFRNQRRQLLGRERWRAVWLGLQR